MTKETQKNRQACNQEACNHLVETLDDIDLREPVEMLLYGEFDDGAYVRIIYKAHHEYTIDTDKDTIAMLADITNYLIEYEGPAEIKSHPIYGEHPIDCDLCGTLAYTEEGRGLVNMSLWHVPGKAAMNFRFDGSDDWETTPVSEDGLLMIRDVIDYIAKEGTRHGKQTENL